MTRLEADALPFNSKVFLVVDTSDLIWTGYVVSKAVTADEDRLMLGINKKSNEPTISATDYRSDKVYLNALDAQRSIIDRKNQAEQKAYEYYMKRKGERMDAEKALENMKGMKLEADNEGV